MGVLILGVEGRPCYECGVIYGVVEPMKMKTQSIDGGIGKQRSCGSIKCFVSVLGHNKQIGLFHYTRGYSFSLTNSSA